MREKEAEQNTTESGEEKKDKEEKAKQRPRQTQGAAKKAEQAHDQTGMSPLARTQGTAEKKRRTGKFQGTDSTAAPALTQKKAGRKREASFLKVRYVEKEATGVIYRIR